ncbi:hypothetical protein IAT40_006010 [Kwoniella sp. CBS 6097]
MFAPLTALLPLLASATLGVQAVTLLGGKARLSSRDEGQEGLPYTWIHPNGDEGLCLAAQGGQLKAGDAVHISTCFGDDDQYGAVQTWSIPFFGDFAEIKLSQNESLCLSEEFRPRGEPSKLYLLSCRFATKWTVHEEQLTTISISGDCRFQGFALLSSLSTAFRSPVNEKSGCRADSR